MRSDCKTATRLNASEVVSQQGGILAVAVAVPPQELVEEAQLFKGDLPGVLEDGPHNVLGTGRGRQRSAVPERVKNTMPLGTELRKTMGPRLRERAPAARSGITQPRARCFAELMLLIHGNSSRVRCTSAKLPVKFSGDVGKQECEREGMN